MKVRPIISPAKDYEELVGLFEIDCAFKLGSLNKVEWHCVGQKHGGGDVNIIISFYMGIIKVVYGETEYDALYSDKPYFVGSTPLINNLELPRLNMHDVLDFMKWDYKLGYV